MKKKIIRFIDCGANIGQSAQWAWRYLSPIPGCELKIDCFEANPKLSKAIEEANSELIEKGTLTVHNNAVDIEKSKKKFYLQNWGSRTGSSLHRFKESIIKQIGFFGQIAVCLPDPNNPGKKMYVDLKYRMNENLEEQEELEKEDERLSAFTPINGEIFRKLIRTGFFKNEHLLYDSVDVESVDLVSWMKESLDLKKEFVILKLDIEGTEYDIISKLFETGFYKKIDALLVEWTPLTKLAYVEEFEDKEEEFEDLIRKTHEQFKFSWDWQHPEEAAAPLLEYISSLK